jgi:hypothetical protein
MPTVFDIIHTTEIYSFCKFICPKKHIRRVAKLKKMEYTTLRMPEISKNIPDFNPSDVLSTYKSRPTAEDDAAPKGLLTHKEPACTNKNSAHEIWMVPKCETPFEKKMYILHEGVGIFEFILNTSVKIARI